ncbi:enoyl-CoA hydratase-related protein, partial [Thermodesulfobacteriota bacterium]
VCRPERGGFRMANHSENFSAGANLALILFMAQEEDWDDLEWAVKALQDAYLKLKYLDKPVVAAPAGMALAGGCEICLAADRVRFAAETYMGLVEMGVGLIPAGGGTKEMLIRNTEHLFEVSKGGLYPKQIELMPFVARAFETIAMAKVATSGPEAVKLGFLRPTDRMTVNRDYLIEDAKNTVIALDLEGYQPPRPMKSIRAAGENTLAMIKLGLWIPLALRANRAGWAVADNVIGKKVTLQGVVGTAVFKVFDLQVARTGLTFAEAGKSGFDPVEVMIRGRSRAHAHPGASTIGVQMVGDLKSGRLLGAQMVGRESAAHRINAVAVALHGNMTVSEFGQSDLAYAPPFGPVWDPLLTAANQLLKKMGG